MEEEVQERAVLDWRWVEGSCSDEESAGVAVDFPLLAHLIAGFSSRVQRSVAKSVGISNSELIHLMAKQVRVGGHVKI